MVRLSATIGDQFDAYVNFVVLWTKVFADWIIISMDKFQVHFARANSLKGFLIGSLCDEITWSDIWNIFNHFDIYVIVFGPREALNWKSLEVTDFRTLF